MYVDGLLTQTLQASIGCAVKGSTENAAGFAKVLFMCRVCSVALRSDVAVHTSRNYNTQERKVKMRGIATSSTTTVCTPHTYCVYSLAP